MKNPFKLLWLMMRFRRPSRVEEMKAVADGFWLGKNYEALTFFGYIVVHSKEEAERINATSSKNDSTKRHEMIHLRQAQSLHNSWFLFYVRYIWYYVRAIPQNNYNRNAAYYLNPYVRAGLFRKVQEWRQRLACLCQNEAEGAQKAVKKMMKIN